MQGSGGTKNFQNTGSSMLIYLILMLLSVLRRYYIMRKQSLPSSPKYFGTFDAGLLLEERGLFPLFEPENKPDK